MVINVNREGVDFHFNTLSFQTLQKNNNQLPYYKNNNTKKPIKNLHLTNALRVKVKTKETHKYEKNNNKFTENKEFNQFNTDTNTHFQEFFTGFYKEYL